MKRRIQTWIYRIKRMVARANFIGEIHGEIFATPIYLKDKVFGKSTKYPTILEIKVKEDAKDALLDHVGEIVRKQYFDFDFYFNVCFSCSQPRLFKKDQYADPFSIWFNVFFGYYEVDVALSTREYPFGYHQNLEVNPLELLKIGKSDWNYFSNFLYGVPLEAIEDEERDVIRITKEEIKGSKVSKEEIHGVSFDKVVVESFKVISPYQSKHGKQLKHEFCNFLWQTFFGYPMHRKEFQESFMPVNMKAIMYICHQKKEDDPDLKSGESEYATYIFGGTINLDYPSLALKNPKNKKSREELEAENERFMDLQIEAIKKAIPDILDLPTYQKEKQNEAIKKNPNTENQLHDLKPEVQGFQAEHAVSK